MEETTDNLSGALTPRGFQEELAKLINKYSLENNSNTPDFILAEYLVNCLSAYEKLHSANRRNKGDSVK